MARIAVFLKRAGLEVLPGHPWSGGRGAGGGKL